MHARSKLVWLTAGLALVLLAGWRAVGTFETVTTEPRLPRGAMAVVGRQAAGLALDLRSLDPVGFLLAATRDATGPPGQALLLAPVFLVRGSGFDGVAAGNLVAWALLPLAALGIAHRLDRGRRGLAAGLGLGLALVASPLSSVAVGDGRASWQAATVEPTARRLLDAIAEQAPEVRRYAVLCGSDELSADLVAWRLLQQPGRSRSTLVPTPPSLDASRLGAWLEAARPALLIVLQRPQEGPSPLLPALAARAGWWRSSTLRDPATGLGAQIWSFDPGGTLR
jgi:hypothetical protein